MVIELPKIVQNADIINTFSALILFPVKTYVNMAINKLTRGT